VGGLRVGESLFGSHRDKFSLCWNSTLTSTELQRTRQAVGPGESQRHQDTHEHGGEVVAQYSEGSSRQVEERSASVMIQTLPSPTG
jgi:hypothetical protein